MPRYLVVAHQTGDSPELIEAVEALARDGDAVFTILVPATPVDHLATWTEGEAHSAAADAADRARLALAGAGAKIDDVLIGDPSPVEAVRDALLMGSYDEIVLSTFPPGPSRWLRMDAVHRLERIVDVPIQHLVAHSRG